MLMEADVEGLIGAGRHERTELWLSIYHGLVEGMGGRIETRNDAAGRSSRSPCPKPQPTTQRA